MTYRVGGFSGIHRNDATKPRHRSSLAVFEAGTASGFARCDSTFKSCMEYIATNLKADKFTFPVLELFSANIDQIASEVGNKVDQAPAFFRNAPIVIDLKSLPPEEEVQFAVLVGLLRSYGLNPVGIRGGSREHAESAVTMELAVLAEDRRNVARTTTKASDDADADADPGAAQPSVDESGAAVNRVHLRPVRSGQKLAAPGGDLILIASASAGSELIAAGNIHVYGALRGRALAGVGGDERCRIFCRRLEAELVSIAGQYRVSEDIDESLRGQSVQIYLESDKLKITSLDES
jgi:septum site-determining protein MinC